MINVCRINIKLKLCNIFSTINLYMKLLSTFSFGKLHGHCLFFPNSRLSSLYFSLPYLLSSLGNEKSLNNKDSTSKGKQAKFASFIH